MCKKNLVITGQMIDYLHTLDHMTSEELLEEIDRHAFCLTLNVNIWLRGNMASTPSREIVMDLWKVTSMHACGSNWLGRAVDWYRMLKRDLLHDREEGMMHDFGDMIIDPKDISMYQVQIRLCNDAQVPLTDDESRMIEKWLDNCIRLENDM